MPSCLFTLAVFVAGSPCAADASKAADAKSDKEKIQGSWKLVTVEEDGETKTYEKQKVVWTFKGDEIITKVGNETRPTSPYKLDPTTTPKQFEQTDTVDQDTKLTFRGIYKLEADNLVICVGRLDRPTEFKAGKGSNSILMTYKREKP